MPTVICPDGSIAQFPDTMSEEEIAAVLRREFPAPRPETLEPGERARRANGAEVAFSPVMQRYVVHDAVGTPRGFRTSLDAAIDLADALPPPPSPRIQPAPAPLMVRNTIEQDIDRHIRQSEGNVRRSQRFEIIDQAGRRRRGRR